jgi:DNA mismatch repair protein MutL
MNRIRLLPEHVANQIAAGEVIERPASVVKELVENSLDAAATHLTIHIKSGGKLLVSVADDGFGMSRDDALLALERHATSKIARAEDLHSIRSLGFRGEAIPSIASVSRFQLTSRERGTLSGTQIEIAGGKIVSVKDVGTAEGTTVEVRNLFFNLPARRKFLRSEQTERAHIEHIVTLCALAHPRVAVRLVVDDRVVFNLAPSAELSARLRELYGGQLVGQLVPVGRASSLSERTNGKAAEREACPTIQVTGFVGKPGVSRRDRSQQHLFVNGRPVESKGINFALLEAYHTALMKGQYPVTFLFVDIDPNLVDVNIHPTKREVRFRDEFAVRQCVINTVREAIEPRGAPVRPISDRGGAFAVPSEPGEPAESARDSRHYTQPGLESAGVAASSEPTAEGDAWRILGVIGQLYVLAESPEGLVLIDQHAAHERVLFEKMLRELAGDAAPSQKLLLPVTLELDARDAAFLQSNLKTLHKLGIGLSEFGDRTFLIDSLPPYFQLENLPQTFRNIVDELRQTGEEVHARRLGEDRIATTVCRHAVKAHDPLKGEELRALFRQLHQCELPYTCPHGRPTMIQISYAELEKKFRRKV